MKTEKQIRERLNKLDILSSADEIGVYIPADKRNKITFEKNILLWTLNEIEEQNPEVHKKIGNFGIRPNSAKNEIVNLLLKNPKGLTRIQIGKLLNNERIMESANYFQGLTRGLGLQSKIDPKDLKYKIYYI